MANPFATPSELATYLRTATQDEADAGSSDVLETAAAVSVLEAASGSIRAVCGWSITTDTATKRVSSSGCRLVMLPTLMLTDVSVTAAGLAVDDSRFTWDENGVVELDRAPWATPVEITYTHGYSEVPPGVKAVCLELSAQRYLNPAQNASESAGAVTTAFARTPADALANDSRLARYRLGAAVG